MADAGSVSKFMFDCVGKITIKTPNNTDEFELNILETSAQDYKVEEDAITIFTERNAFFETKKQIEEF